jgi:hypothetical protein|tara:strand:- start:214 stop:315 length:102 start_codon:yes stop_codon:yes gene_type:complete
MDGIEATRQQSLQVVTLLDYSEAIKMEKQNIII